MKVVKQKLDIRKKEMGKNSLYLINNSYIALLCRCHKKEKIVLPLDHWNCKIDGKKITVNYTIKTKKCNCNFYIINSEIKRP